MHIPLLHRHCVRACVCLCVCARLIPYQCVDKPITINCVNSIKINFISDTQRFSIIPKNLFGQAVGSARNSASVCENIFLPLMYNVQGRQKKYVRRPMASIQNPHAPSKQPMQKSIQFFFIFLLIYFLTTLHMAHITTIY